MPYLADLERSGIPTALITYHEQAGKVEHDRKEYGVPEMRYLVASRYSPGGVTEADKIAQPLLDLITKPLTAKEKKSGKWAPEQPRILFEGTLEEAEKFYNQEEKLPAILNAPFSTYTDGLPVVIPTEERVKEMLKGTSHKPDEVITLQQDKEPSEGMRSVARKRGEVIRFMPMYRTATVEQVAVNAVMAGCKPEYFPVVLTIAEAGGGTGDGRGFGGAWMVSGPIYKEVGMNVTNFLFGPGNAPNKTIGRVGSLMWRNLGGYKEMETTITTVGNAVANGGFIFAEYAEGLPPGWKGLNEELGFRKDESVLMPANLGPEGSWLLGQFHQPGIYRSLQRTGHGAIARFLGVKGIVGPHNYFEFLCKGIWACREGGFTLVIPPQIAMDMYNYGFKTKQSIYEFFWKKSFEPIREYRLRGTTDEPTNGWMGIERTSGKRWRELSDDYMVPAGGPDPFSSYNIMVFNQEETACARFGGGHVPGYSIDAWR